MKNNSNMKLLFELLIIKLTNGGLINETPKKSNDNDKDIVKIRVNNTLCDFNKKDFLAFKNEFEMLYNIDNSEFDALIKRGILKAYSSNNFIMMFESTEDAESFNKNYKQLDDIFEKMFDRKIKGVAVDKIAWDKIKTDFNSGLKKYKYIEEEN